MKLIGLGGLKQSGKTTIARHLRIVAAQNMKAAVTYSFAAPIKRMLDTLLIEAGTSVNQRETYRLHKDKPIMALGGFDTRYLLQTLGTEWGRDLLGENFWADIGERKLFDQKADLVIFDDVRFESEAEMIHRNGGKVVQLRRQGVTPTDSHRSEVAKYEPDLVVANDDEPLRVAEYIWKMSK